MIREAADFAAKAHEGMLRKGSRIPYIYHPMEVALCVAQMTADPDVIAAAYLHDVLEDTSATREELRLHFGNRVLEMVLAETEDKRLSWRERKAATVEHLATASREVKILTLADKLSNLHSTAVEYLMHGDRVWQRFNEKKKSSHQWYYKGIIDALQDMEEFPQYQELKRLYKFVFGT